MAQQVLPKHTHQSHIYIYTWATKAIPALKHT